jgi:hypothetical protein
MNIRIINNNRILYKNVTKTNDKIRKIELNYTKITSNLI